MLIEDLGYIIRSTISNEFILHFPNYYDLRVTADSAERRDDFLNLAKLRFAHIQPKYTLKIFGIPVGSLKEYHATPNKKKYNFNNMPSDDLRLHDEEIKSAVEFEPP
mmetsp:Transcript_20984/g.20104  ORF Transcript_20984/g.20104 Transcript_20984/m.20104 type:complete len:107 (+) Transcript_20984:198-518(+)